MEPAELHRMVERSVNAGAVEALVALYEPDAVLLGEDGSEYRGNDAIAAAWGAVVAFGGRIALRTRSAIEVGDLALLSNAWTYDLGGAVVASGVTAEVARRQADGSWR